MWMQVYYLTIQYRHNRGMILYVYRWFVHSDVDNLLFIPCPVHYSLAERR